MRSEYRKILKEIRKGKAIAMIVKCRSSPRMERLRLLTKESSEWASITYQTDFKKSCFHHDGLPTLTVQLMDEHDSEDFDLIEWCVL